MAEITVKITLRVLQVEDGTWRIVMLGKERDLLSSANRPFATREEAEAAIKSLSEIQII